MSITDIANVTITKETATVSRAGFGTPCIFTYHTKDAARALRFEKSSDMLVAGGGPFAATDQAYILANKMFSQNPKPKEVVVARRSFPTIRTVNVTVVDATVNGEVYPLANQLYRITINGVNFDFTSDGTPTALEICAGLAPVINAGSENVLATDNLDGTLTIEKAVTPGGVATAGEAFTIAMDRSLMTMKDDTPAAVGGTLAAEIAALQDFDDDWYGLCGDWYGEIEILAVSAAIESLAKIHGASSSDDEMYDAAVTDCIGSQLQTLAYGRTFCFHHPTADQGVAAADLGRCLPLDPGSETWMFKTLAGIPYVDYTATEKSALEGKNIERYIRIGGQNMTAEGKMSGGEYIDVTRFIDFLQARMQENIFGRLKNLDKVAYTNKGISIVETEVRGTLALGISVGGLAADPAPTVTVPNAIVGHPDGVSSADKANRLLPNVEFCATLAGAIHAVEVSGKVTI